MIPETMKPLLINLPPQAPPPAKGTPECREWMDRIAQCAASCGRTIESRKLKPNEVPVVIASLIVALSDHTGMDLEKVITFCGKAARGLKSATPEQPPTLIPS